MSSKVLSPKVALITGASSGIGRALTLTLLETGVDCLATGRDRSRLDELEQEYRQGGSRQGGRLEIFNGDVGLPDDAARLLDFIKKRWGRLDILINNAGHGVYGPDLEIPEEEIQRLFEIHYLVPWRLCRDCKDLFRAASGEKWVVMISSIAGIISVPWLGHYGAAKAALIHLSRSLRIDLGPEGVKVLNVMPGRTAETRFSEQSRYFGGVVLQRGGGGGITSRDVARLTLAAMTQGRRELIIGWTNRLAVRIYRLAAPIFERLWSRIFGPW